MKIISTTGRILKEKILLVRKIKRICTIGIVSK